MTAADFWGYVLSYLCGVESLAIVWLLVNWLCEVREYREQEARDRMFDAAHGIRVVGSDGV